MRKNKNYRYEVNLFILSGTPAGQTQTVSLFDIGNDFHYFDEFANRTILKE